jgi:hypothetical protein
MVAAVGCLALPASGLAQTIPLRLTVSPQTVSAPLPADYLGLAIEYDEVPMWAGTAPGSVNPVLAQLIDNLDPGGHPLLRIGGLSTERTWWPVPGWTRPRGLTYTLTPAWMAQARNLAGATHAQLLPGVNLEANQPHLAQVEAQQLVSGLGADLAGLEIGNEPELYTSIPWYKTLGGRLLPWYSAQGTPVFSRRATYGPTQFLQEFARTVKVMPPHVSLAGPVTGDAPWLKAFSPYIRRNSPIRTVTWHAYGLNECVSDPHSPQFPSVPNLLSPTASRGFIAGIGGFAAQAHRAGAAFRIDELGSVTCNGRTGVSNTMASALWVMDALFTMASDGVDGVNLHTYPGTPNALFDFAHAGTAWEGYVHPMYYGALMFSQADPAGARLLKTTLSAPSSIRAWATRGADRRTRILLINDSLRASAQAQVAVAGGGGAAAIERLSARSAYATNDVTLGGQSFANGTRTGQLPPSLPQAVAARAGAYTVAVPSASAVLLTLPAPGRAAASSASARSTAPAAK